MRGTDEAQPQVLEVACFPLVPFCNRIRGGTFECDGRIVHLPPNLPPDASPLHGQGWLSPWSVVSCDAQQAWLRFHHEAGEWPWSYEAEQHFDLDARGLSLTLTCLNLSDTPMPCGMGLHPYFPCGPETLLNTQVEYAWTIDDAVLPVARVPAQGRFDLRTRRVCGQDLDNGFGGWHGSAQITWQDGVSLSFSSPDARFFQLYSPLQGGLFVAEPVQHANAALNEPRSQWEALGLVLLAPGAARELTVRFDVSAR